MSLEAQIEQLNTNIVALIGVMSTGAALAAPATPAKSATKKAAPVAAPVAETSPTPKPAAAPQPAAAPTPATTATVAPTIEEARALVIKLGQVKGREAVMALLTKFGASKLPEVPPHLYGAVIAGATEALAA